MPVILGPDGPSLGGFVCPVTVVRDELWKLGQLRPGDTVQFVRVAADVVSALPGGAADGAIASNTAETDAAASSATQTFVTAPAAALAPA
ncbi:hypothetical protein SB780_36725, partial [Burkholderia sp. SIMBA_057]